MLQKNNKSLHLLYSCVQRITSKIGNENLALCLMTVANLLWPISFLYVSQHHFSPFQTNLARGISICFTHILLCLLLGIDLDFKSSRDLKYLIIRNSLIGIHQLVYAGMYFVLSYPLINSIVITGPLFVFILDYYLNGVTITRSQGIGIAVSFTGILVNINGDFLMNLIDPSFRIESTYENYFVTDVTVKILFSLVAVFTNVLWGYAIVVQKKIKHVPGIKISYFLGVEFVVTSGIRCSMGEVRPVSMEQFLWACLLSGAVMSFCQMLFISALNLSKNAGKLTILMLLYGVPSYAISFFKFGEQVNLICVIGLIMMGMGLYRTLFTGTI